MSDTIANAQLVQAVARFVPESGTIQRVGNALHVLRVRSGERELVVRQWPSSASRERVALTIEALARGHAANPALPEPVRDPDGGIVAIDGRLFSATVWLPGQPLARYGDFRLADGAVIDVPLPASAPSPEVIVQAARAIGAFHVATAELAEGKSTPHPLTRRLASTERTWEQQRKQVGREAADYPEIRRWLRCGNRVVPVAGELLRKSGDTGNRIGVTHGDLWPANLLVEGAGEGKMLTGIAGWSRVAIDTPLVDLAHLVTHTSGWSGARAEEVLAAYTDVAPLSPVERRLLPVVAALDLLPTVGSLLLLSFVDERLANHEAQPVLRSGMKSLLSSLENLTHVLAPDEEWGQRQVNSARQDRRSSGPRKPPAPRTKPSPRPGSGRSPRG